MRRAVLSCLAAALLASPSLADEIVLRDGRRLTDVKITDESYDTVKYKILGAPQQLPAHEVAKIIHDDAPLAYRQGEEALAAGNFDEAARRFRSATARGGWVKVYGLFHAAEAYRLGSRFEQAAETYEQLLSAAPRSRFVPQARLGLARCKLERGEYAQARALYEQLANEARAKQLGKRWEYTAKLGIAESWEREGDTRRAARLYGALATEAFNDAAIAAAAKLGALRTEADDRRAIEDLDALIDADKTPDAVRAAAYLERGRRYGRLGEHKKALLSFLRAAYDPNFRPYAATRAEALYRAAAAFEKAQTEDAAERAAALRRELKRSFPHSPWAQKS